MRTLLLVILLAACSPPEAPTELSELGRFLIREFDNGDPALLQSGATNLAALMHAVDFEGATVDRSTIPAHLEPGDVEGLRRPPGTDLENTVDVSLYYRSRHRADEHAAFTVESDQLSAEPSAVGYERALLEGGDCFAGGQCSLLRTVNDVLRENGLFSLQFELFKDFRRAETDDGRSVLLSRAWTEEGFEAHVGTANLRQSWTLDVFIDAGEGAERLRINWAETTFDPPIEEYILRNTTRSSMQDALEAADGALDTQAVGEWSSLRGGASAPPPGTARPPAEAAATRSRYSSRTSGIS